jgi:hypothetical protein
MLRPLDINTVEGDQDEIAAANDVEAPAAIPQIWREITGSC